MELKAKRYFSRIPGAHFTMPDGFQIFLEELEHLVNSGNPLIFDQEHAGAIVQPLPDGLDPSKVAKSEAEINAQDQRLASGGGRVTGDVNKGEGQITDPNASTVDAELRNVVFKETGPGVGSPAAMARAAAAKRAAEQQATTAASQNKTGMI